MVRVGELPSKSTFCVGMSRNWEPPKRKSLKRLNPWKMRVHPSYLETADTAKKRFLNVLEMANKRPNEEPKELPRIDPLKKFMCTFKGCYFIYDNIRAVAKHYLSSHTLCGMEDNGVKCVYKFQSDPDIQKHTREVHPNLKRKRIFLDRYRCVDCFIKLLKNPEDYKNGLPDLAAHQAILGRDWKYNRKLNGLNACCKKRRNNILKSPGQKKVKSTLNVACTSESGSGANVSRPIPSSMPLQQQEQRDNFNGGDAHELKGKDLIADDNVCENGSSNCVDFMDFDLQEVTSGVALFDESDVIAAISSAQADGFPQTTSRVTDQETAEEIRRLKLELEALRASHDEIQTKYSEQEEKLKKREEKIGSLEAERSETRRKLESLVNDGGVLSQLKKELRKVKERNEKEIKLKERAKKIEEWECKVFEKNKELEEKAKEIGEEEKKLVKKKKAVNHSLSQLVKWENERLKRNEELKKSESDMVKRLKELEEETEKKVKIIKAREFVKINEKRNKAMGEMEVKVKQVEAREKDVVDRERAIEEKAKRLARMEESLNEKWKEVKEKTGKVEERDRALKRKIEEHQQNMTSILTMVDL